MPLRALLLAAPLVAGLAAAPALAQSADGRGGDGRPGYDQGGYPTNGDARGSGQYRDGDAEGRAGPPSSSRPAEGGFAEPGQAPPDLGRELGLRPDQRSALQAYQQATTPSQAEQQAAQADLGRLRTMTTPQRLDFTARQMQQEQADFSRRALAVRRFYGQLTPQQQRRFDDLTGPGQGDDQDGPQGRPDTAGDSSQR